MEMETASNDQESATDQNNRENGDVQQVSFS